VSSEKYYKVLKNGKSLKGGSLEWSLPEDGKPGEWHEVKGVLSLCDNGLHITKTPIVWWEDGAECFEVEWAGDKIGDDNKAVVRKCRLVRMLTDEDLCKLGIFRSGSHEVKSGTVAASGSAIVRASDSAVVTAYGSAIVKAYSSAIVKAYGSASVTAYGSAIVRAHDSVNVTAYDFTSVRAYDYVSVTACGFASVIASGSAIVRAYDSAIVRAYGSVSVRARSHSTVNTYSGEPDVDTEGRAVHIDRSVFPPIIRRGWAKS